MNPILVHHESKSLTRSYLSMPQTPPSEVQVVGNYKLEKTLGQGTYGKVKLATDTRTNEKVPPLLPPPSLFLLLVNSNGCDRLP